MVNELPYWFFTEWMTVLKTLCFCYLGLIHSNCLVTTSDITRWVNQGKVPYYNVTNIFTTDMKLFSYDFHTFVNKPTPHPHIIRETAGKLANFLGLTELPDFPLSKLIHKYLIQLELPGELHVYVENLVRSHPPKIRHNIADKLPHYEVVAMVYIITVLQLLLGLDDFTERKLSEYARQINRLLNDDNRLFIWEDWSFHINKKFHSNKAQQIYAKEFDPNAVHDVDVFMEHFHILKSKRNPDNRGKVFNDKYVKTREITKDSIQRPIQLLMTKWNLSSKSTKCLSENEIAVSSVEHGHESDDDSLSPLIEEDPIGFLLSDKPLPDKNSSLKKTKETSFTEKTLKYITHTDNFLDSLDKRGLSDFTIYSSFVEESDSSSESASEDDKSPKSSNINNTRLRKIDSSKSAVKNIVSDQAKKRGKLEKVDETELSEIIHKLAEMREDFKLNRETALKSRAYIWLLEICSFIINCESEDLHKELLAFQSVLIN